MCVCIIHRIAKNWTLLSNFHFECLVVFPTFFNLSLNFAIRISWSETQSDICWWQTHLTYTGSPISSSYLRPSCLRQWIIVHFGLITSSLTQSSLSVKFALKINGKYYLWTIFCCVSFHKHESLLFLHRDMEVSGLVLITLSIITSTWAVIIVSIILRAKNEHYGMITLCQPGNSKCCVIAHWIYAHTHRHTHTYCVK